MKGKRHETGKKWSQATPQQWSTTSTGTPRCHLKDIRKEGSVCQFVQACPVKCWANEKVLATWNLMV